jgi:serine phosphatase RsbU (regulator of sigma subunit)
MMRAYDLFSSNFYEVLEAADGRIGIDLSRRAKPDLVLCDISMPEVNGIEVLQTITQENPALPIIMVTGTGVIDDVINSLKLGAWDYITKPFEDILVINHAVAKALERARLLQANREYQAHLEAANRQLTESLRKLEEDETAARKMQFHLLPDNHQAWGRYRFSRVLYPSLYLSGDFIDYFIIDGDHAGFYIADVSGHGASSAMMTVLLRSHINHHLRRFMREGTDKILHPEAMLVALNHAFLSENIGKYATIFYGVLSMKHNTLLYANGGQAPCPVLRNGNQATFLEGRSVPVGLFPRAQYNVQSISLPGHFDMALFSDGILEILPSPSLREREAYLPALIARMDNPTVEAISQQLALESQANYPDDIAILLISRRID